MTRHIASPRGRARVAIVGAESAEGTRVREILAERGVEGSRVDLYATLQGEVLLSEYAGEARLIQEPVVDEIAAHDLVFVCETGQLVRDVAARTSRGTLILDLVEALPPDRRLLGRRGPDPGRARESGVVTVPHPLTLALAELLGPLERELGLSEAVAVVIRPAADFGQQAVEELREQVVRLLNFSAVPTETFGRQLAFNLIPQGRLGCEAPGVESRIARDVGAMLGWLDCRLSVRLLAAPLFYGHGLQVRCRLSNGSGVEEVRRVLEAAGYPVAGEQDCATPIDVSGERRIVLSEVSDDGLGGFWLWAVSGETDSMGAEEAVRIAVDLGDL